jgi:hypothetical protein
VILFHERLWFRPTPDPQLKLAALGPIPKVPLASSRSKPPRGFGSRLTALPVQARPAVQVATVCDHGLPGKLITDIALESGTLIIFHVHVLEDGLSRPDCPFHLRLCHLHCSLKESAASRASAGSLTSEEPHLPRGTQLNRNRRKEVVAPPKYTKSRPVLAQYSNLSEGLGGCVVYRRSGAVPLGRAVSPEGRSGHKRPHAELRAQSRAGQNTAQTGTL